MAMIRPEAEMKESGIEWIGNIPRNWKMRKINSLFENIGSGTTPNSNIEEYYQGMINWLQSGDINGTIVKSTKKHISNEIVSNTSALTVYKAPFIAIAMYGASIGNISIVDIDACTNQACCVLVKPTKDIYMQFAFWGLMAAKEELVLSSRGGGQPNISQNIIKQLRIPVPNISEQENIADYLDKTCSKIDEIIAEAKASINEYKELKKSVITNITTHGLRDASLINSGNMDIEMIPNTWSICKTLYGLAMPITDGPHVTPKLLDEGIAFISAEAVSCGRGSIDFNHMRGYISEEFYNECCKKYVPQRDDIYMIKSGATTGTVSIVDTDRKFTIWSPLAVFRVNRDRLNPRYLFYFLQSKPYQQQVQLGWTFGTQQNIGMRTLEQLKICIPPLVEQAEIVEYLDNKLPQIESLIIEKESLIADLEAYKKSLIYEVVTGKRRVV